MTSPNGVTLVTGAGGMLGSAIVRRLVAEGGAVRSFHRAQPKTPVTGVEMVFGDLGDPAAVDRAIAGVTQVIHAGAAMKGPWAEHQVGTVAGTANVVSACLRHGVEKLVHVSSLSVVDWAGSAGGAPISEETALEPRATERGAYTRAKLESEKLVTCAVAEEGLRAVILRPGLIFDDRGPLTGGAVARRILHRWVVLGDGELRLPLVYLDDVVDAILLAARGTLSHGEVLQLVDGGGLTQNQVLDALGARVTLRMPRSLLFALGTVSEWGLRLVGRASPFSRYRLRSGLAKVCFQSERAEALLGWRPRVGVAAGLARVRTQD